MPGNKQPFQNSTNQLWGTVEVWSLALGLPAWLLRERLEGVPSQLTWEHEEQFDYVTDAYAEDDVLLACGDLLLCTSAA